MESEEEISFSIDIEAIEKTDPKLIMLSQKIDSVGDLLMEDYNRGLIDIYEDDEDDSSGEKDSVPTIDFALPDYLWDTDTVEFSATAIDHYLTFRKLRAEYEKTLNSHIQEELQKTYGIDIDSSDIGLCDEDTEASEALHSYLDYVFS